jgi:hypothetical protein
VVRLVLATSEWPADHIYGGAVLSRSEWVPSRVLERIEARRVWVVYSFSYGGMDRQPLPSRWQASKTESFPEPYWWQQAVYVSRVDGRGQVGKTREIGVRRSEFGVRRSEFGDRRSEFEDRRSEFGDRCSEESGERRALAGQ